MQDTIPVARSGNNEISLVLNMANRHGLNSTRQWPGMSHQEAAVLFKFNYNEGKS